MSPWLYVVGFLVYVAGLTLMGYTAVERDLPLTIWPDVVGIYDVMPSTSEEGATQPE